MLFRNGVRVVFAFVMACVACSTRDASGGADADAPPATFGRGEAGVDPFDGDASLAARVGALVVTRCAGGPETACHATGVGGTHLDLGPGGDVVGVPSMERPDLVRVQPFEPAKSYMFAKVAGDGGIEGGRMPLDTPDFDARIPALVGAWIEAGAP